MKLALFPSLLALAFAHSAFAAPTSLRDFQLPPEPTPTPTSSVQGPVDTEGPVPVRPRAIPTVRPTARPNSAPTAQPSPPQSPAANTTTGLPNASTPAPRETAPTTVRVPVSPRATQPAPAARTTTTPSPAPESVLGPELGPPAPESSASVPAARFEPQPAPAPETIVEQEDESGSSLWMWVLLGLLAAGVAGFFVWRRMQGAAQTVPTIAPPIVRPKVPQTGAPAATPASTGDKPPLALVAEAVRVSRSIMNVTLSYRLTLTNNTGHALTGLGIGGDLVSAHGALPVDQQFADATIPLQQIATVESLAPGETRELKGDIRLPLNQIRPLRQGKSPLLVPLLRLRADGAGLDPLVQTYVVGIKPPQQGARLQPFRLDETPQGYTRIGLRALA